MEMNGNATFQQWQHSLLAPSNHHPQDRPTAAQKNWTATDPPSSLTCTSNISALALGTGHAVFAHTLLPALAAARREILFVTCFWASSATLSGLNDTLRQLSAQRLRDAHHDRESKLRVRVCFSSASLLQKLLHPSSTTGRTYAPREWKPRLGLPAPEELGGLDLRVKSVFVRPFSVMHPKFVVVDRQRVFLPSCNVSWEAWLEGCVEMSGRAVVARFVRFWAGFWAEEGERGLECGEWEGMVEDDGGLRDGVRERAPKLLHHIALDEQDIPTLFLPSPHHRNPRFALLPWRSCPPPPQTPLNVFLLAAFATAHRTISIQTPNLTAPPVLSALLGALARGVDVSIVTSERLMVLEQLLTAGTTTGRCVRWLTKKHRALLASCNASPDLEAGEVRKKPGHLRVSFYAPSTYPVRGEVGAEPVQSHLKLTIVDALWTVLGSGNMDRASWFTSQELGLAFYSAAVADKVGGAVGELMKDRGRRVYDSREDG